jgi:hypothetical protein
MLSGRRLCGLAALTAALLLSACANSREPIVDIVTVEGSVVVRGNEPFAEYVLETAERNLYVLRFPEMDAPSTPAVLTVTGRLYAADWDGRPFAHIDVQEMENRRDGLAP